MQLEKVGNRLVLFKFLTTHTFKNIRIIFMNFWNGTTLWIMET